MRTGRADGKTRRAVIIRNDRLGDLILTTPLVRALSSSGYIVDVVAKRDFLEVLHLNPLVSNSQAFEDICPEFPKGWMRLRNWIAERGYELTIVVPAQPKEMIFASALTGVRQRFALYGGKLARLTLHRVAPSSILVAESHYAEKMLFCADNLGIPRQGIQPELILSAEEQEWGSEALAARFSSQCTIVVHPGGGGLAYGKSASTCNLPLNEYERLCQRILSQSEWNVVITGNSIEAQHIARWDGEVLANSRCWNASGSLSIRQLSAVIRASTLTVVSSSAPLHIASALGKPTLSPFCPGFSVSTRCWGNLGGEAWVVERSQRTCPRIKDPGALCGDFGGEIDGKLLFEKLSAMVDSLREKSHPLRG